MLLLKVAEYCIFCWPTGLEYQSDYEKSANGDDVYRAGSGKNYNMLKAQKRSTLASKADMFSDDASEEENL